MTTRFFAPVAALALSAGVASAQQAVIQFGPTTPYSTLQCRNFRKIQPTAWQAVSAERFGLGFVQNIVPPRTPIVSGNWIYNNIDLFSQLELQCGGAAPVVAKY